MEMKARKSSSGYLLYGLTTLLILVVFFVVAGLISRSSESNVFADMTLWLILGAVGLALFLIMFFSYLCLPKILMNINDQRIIIYGPFAHTTIIPFQEITNVGLYPGLVPLRFRPDNFVISTKNRGSFVVGYLQQPAKVYAFFKDRFDAFLVTADADYFRDMH